MTTAAAAGLILAFAFILERLGPLDPAASILGAAAGILVWGCAEAASGFSSAAGGARGRILGAVRAGGPALGLLVVLPHAGSTLERLSWVCVAACLGPGARRDAAVRLSGLALAIAMALEHLPFAWRFEVALSRTVSRMAGALSGQDLDWGPTASGLDLLWLFLAALASGAAGGTGVLRRAVLCVLAWPIHVALAPVLAAWRPAWIFGHGGLLNHAGEHLSVGPGDRAPAIFLLSWIWCAALLALCFALRPAGRAGARGAAVVAAGRWNPVAAAALLAITVAGACLADRAAAGTPAAGPIRLVKSPLFDLESPAAGRFGIASSGMLGLLGRYAALGGHTLEEAERPVDESVLAGARTVMVMLPPAPFTQAEKAAIDRFVRAGGSLLVLGDHTDLLGTMGPINDLTGPYGIRVRFDSAYPARREWRGCLRSRLPRGQSRTGIGTGASLALDATARPLVIGTHALADAGDRANDGRGAWLGDYAWQPGEPLGDLVLAAEARAGRGRVVVMGDTSSFQNVALPWSWDFVSGLLDHLASPPPWWEAPARAAPGLAGILLALSCLRAGRPAWWAAAAACGLLGAAVAGDPGSPAAGRPLPQGAPVALVDDGHLNDWTRELWHDTSVGGLLANLQRQGWLPLVTSRAAERLAGPGSLAVLVAPRQALSTREAALLADHIEAAGRVLVAAGGPEAAAVSPLLSLYGLDILPIPLGPVPVRPDLTRDELARARQAPQFRNAWPVRGAGAAPTRSLYGAFGYDVVVRAEARSGSGGALIVVGDPEFLTDRILENEHDAWPGNVDLVARLLSGENP